MSTHNIPLTSASSFANPKQDDCGVCPQNFCNAYRGGNIQPLTRIAGGIQGTAFNI